MNNIEPVQIFVRLETSDVRLLDIQRRIDKISLIQIWVMRAISLFERYLKLLDKIDSEKDSIQRGILIEELDICFMSSVSYFLRGFLNQKGSYSLEINTVTNDILLRQTYKMLMDLRNDEYVHWKGARSSAYAKYSFSAVSETQCDFGKEVQVQFSESVGPAQNTTEIRNLFQATLTFIDHQSGNDLQKIRERLQVTEAWTETQLYNEKNEPLIKKS